MTHLPNLGQFAIELFAKLTHKLALRPREPVIVKRDRQHVLFDPTIPFDLIGVAAIAAVTPVSLPL
jgi:hypothetical protein